MAESKICTASHPLSASLPLPPEETSCHSDPRAPSRNRRKPTVRRTEGFSDVRMFFSPCSSDNKHNPRKLIAQGCRACLTCARCLRDAVQWPNLAQLERGPHLMTAVRVRAGHAGREHDRGQNPKGSARVYARACSSGHCRISHQVSALVAD